MNHIKLEQPASKVTKVIYVHWKIDLFSRKLVGREHDHGAFYSPRQQRTRYYFVQITDFNLKEKLRTVLRALFYY